MTLSPPLKPIVFALTVALWTFVGATPAILIAHYGLPAAMIWLANSVAILVMLRHPTASWAAGLIGATLGFFVANMAMGTSVPLTLAYLVTNLAEVVTSIVLLRRYVGDFPWAPAQLPRGMAIVMGAGPLACGTFGSFILLAQHGIPIPAGILIWFAGASAAALLVFSATWALSMIQQDDDVSPWSRAGIWTVLLASTLYIFTHDTLPLLFVPPALLSLFGLLGLPRQGVLAMLFVGACAILAVHSGTGPMSLIALTHADLLGFLQQIYLLALGLATIPAAVQYLAVQDSMRALQRSEALATTANRAKSDFLATMSHELRTPVAGVSGYLQLLRDTPLSKAQTRYLDRIDIGVGHLRMVIGDVLDLSKIEAGALALQPGPVKLSSLAEACVGLIAGQVADDVIIRTIQDPGLPEFVRVDGARLQQVLMNLLNNAAKFTEVGSILLHIRRAAGAPGWVEILVRDTGCGIAEDELPRVLERFHQASESRERTHGGSGLGLHIAQQIVLAMQGELLLTSTLGLGTQVCVRLPLEEIRAPEGAQDTPHSAPAPCTPTPLELSVLLVEDDPVMRELMEIHLQRLGCQVRSFEAPQAALSCLESQHFDVLLSDLHMPGMDGFGLLRRARRIRPELPAFLMTADATPEAERLAHATGFQQVLLKPIPHERLREALSGEVLSSTAAPPTRAAVLVDQSALQELGQVMDEKELRILLAHSLERFDAQLAALRNEETPNPERAAIAHQLRGTAGSLSLSALHAQATLLEDAAEADESDEDIQARVELLARTLQETRDALNALALLPEGGARGAGKVLAFKV
ncbi:MAG: response regulator [Alphaproteobacteria bacterium]|nr:response regulator [Alphaproteobacteria bacterium]